MDDGYSEKRKKSWKEIDRQRDGSGQRRKRGTDRGSGARPGRSSERYRAALEQAFNTGNMGKVAERLASAMPDGPDPLTVKKKSKRPPRQKLIHNVTTAVHTRDAVQALDELIKHYGLCEDYDLLTRALEHPDEDVVIDSMKLLRQMIETQKPRRARTLVARLRLLEDDFDTPEEIKKLARELQRLL